ncbi:MAG: serine O-acetyltransferase [Cuniculiplasma sp.]
MNEQNKKLTIGEQLILEAEDLCRREPVLKSVLYKHVLSAQTATRVISSILASRLAAGNVIDLDLLRTLLCDILLQNNELFEKQLEADILAVKTRDPSYLNILNIVLNFKGFHALQLHRAAHLLWRAGRLDVALWLSNMASFAFTVDIHPAARLGKGLMLDHGTGIVIGETTVVDDGVSILQDVTLGGTGKEQFDRHPKIRHGVLIGAGAKILGNIEIGAMSKVASGSVVLKDVPPNCTVAGVPAKVMRYHDSIVDSAAEMNQLI